MMKDYDEVLKHTDWYDLRRVIWVDETGHAESLEGHVEPHTYGDRIYLTVQPNGYYTTIILLNQIVGIY